MARGTPLHKRLKVRSLFVVRRSCMYVNGRVMFGLSKAGDVSVHGV